MTLPDDAAPARGTSTTTLLAAAFGAYFCMYAFRKPITVVELAGEQLAGSAVELKTALLIGQLVGYALSKFIGVVVCTAVSRRRLLPLLVGLVLVAEAALVGYAVLPGGWSVAAMFVNGLPLGMVWGLVIRFLEGRRTSDALMAGLSAAYIVSSGAEKDVGLWVLERGVSEAWMPAASGAIFLVPYLVCVAVLDRSSPPSEAEAAERAPRGAMNHQDRQAFVGRFALGLVPLIVAYLALTAYRDFRDNYGVEIFRELGYLDMPGLFTLTEFPAGIGVIVALGVLTVVKNHRRALKALYVLMFSGFAVILLTSIAYRAGALSGLQWMILLGVGGYLAYVPVGSVFFERLTAAGGSAGTAVLGIYWADALGYTGSVGVQLYKDIFSGDVTRLAFFQELTWWLGVTGGVLVLVSARYVFAALDAGAANSGEAGT